MKLPTIFAMLFIAGSASISHGKDIKENLSVFSSDKPNVIQFGAALAMLANDESVLTNRDALENVLGVKFVDDGSYMSSTIVGPRTVWKYRMLTRPSFLVIENHQGYFRFEKKERLPSEQLSFTLLPESLCIDYQRFAESAALRLVSADIPHPSPLDGRAVKRQTLDRDGKPWVYLQSDRNGCITIFEVRSSLYQRKVKS